ncbi:MAG TPA: hypothetical protein VF471_08745 [Pseudoxanthomonas sp.]
MKCARSILLISLSFSIGTAIAADPVETNKPASAQAMDHGKMGMSHGQMDHGQTPPAKGSAAFIKLDANKDGKISRTEMARDPKAAHFGMLDTNKDGALSPTEFAKASGM